MSVTHDRAVFGPTTDGLDVSEATYEEWITAVRSRPKPNEETPSHDNEESN